MEKIKMPHPIAELGGDEMTHVLWGKIKEQLILPFVELNTEYYDLGLPNRERTADQVTRDAAEAIRRLQAAELLEQLPDKLQETAALRLEYPELSLSELAAEFDPPVSKSCLNHRLRKLLELSRDLSE